MHEELFANMPDAALDHADILNHLEQGVKRQTRMAWKNIFAFRWRTKQQIFFINPYTTFIDRRATIGEGTIIYPGVMITGPCIIGKHCIIGPNLWVHNCVFGDRVQYGARANLFASEIGDDTKIGAQSEVTRSRFGKKVNNLHHGYLGDVFVEDGVNIGAGTIACNFDGGPEKKKTIIRRGAFIGTNTNLVAPIEIPEEIFVAAGTTVSQKDLNALQVSAHALIIGRPDPRIIPNFFEKIGNYRRKIKKFSPSQKES
ncbi:hypothetical protein KGQ34_04130 [Patescibacteria group bacterium]|nr:hypothetical protein [Patescibacteria group bacterium]